MGLIEGAAVARRRASGTIGRVAPPRFAPAGQSTQVIVGADRTDDIAILDASASLYASYGLKRVYYAAFSPTGHPSAQLPHAGGLQHRGYWSDSRPDRPLRNLVVKLSRHRQVPLAHTYSGDEHGFTIAAPTG